MKFDYLKDYILQDERLKIVPLKETHHKELLKISNDSDIWEYLLENGSDSTSLKIYIDNAIRNRKLNKQYPFLVIDKKYNEVAGTTSLYSYDSKLNTIKLGHTWYGKKFRGTGINKHCKYLLFEFAFENIRIERIGFGVHSKNIVSNLALKSIGCKREGVLRSFLPPLNGLGKRNDIYIWSILKEEWNHIVKKELKEKLNN